MTSKIIVNNVGADVGIASVHFDSNIQRGSSNLHSTGLNVTDTFLHSTGLNVTSDSSINIGTGATISQPATNSLALGTNSNERLRIGPAGQIGLGGANYGTPGQTLTSAGPSSAATWTTINVSQLFSSYAIIADRKNYTIDAGSITANTWTQRDLNTEIADPDGIVSLANNRFFLGSGTYLIKWRCPGTRVQEFNSALYNDTDSTYVAFGESAYSYSADGDTSYAVGMARVTVSGTKGFEIRMITNTSVNNTGMGRGAASMGNFNSAGGQETYTTVEIYKEG
tara:strand:- start:394 stop:1239 length:846 start_codon:yes stop_codon:yes gene_type:complete